MFGKRGVISFVTLLEITMGVLIAFLFYTAATSIGDQERVEEFARAKDIALLLETMQATQYDVSYSYPETISASRVEVQNQVVTIVPNNLVTLRPEYFTTSQFGFNIVSPGIDFTDAIVNGAFFTLLKQGRAVSLSNGTARIQLEDEVRGLSRNEVRLGFRVKDIPNQGTGSFLTRTKNSVEGELQQSFTLDENATHYLGFSFNDTSVIYYQDSSEMKALAQRLQERLTASGSVFTLLAGPPLFTQGEQAIQIQFSSVTEDSTRNRVQLFAREVRQTYEAFFEE